MMKKKKIIGLTVLSMISFASIANANPIALADTVIEQVESQYESLDYANAIDIALDNNINLKRLKKDLENAELNKETAVDNIFFTPYDRANPMYNAEQITYHQSRLGVDASKKQIALAEDILSYAVVRTYNSVIKAEEQIKLLEKQLEEQEYQLNLANIRYQQGVVSSYELLQSQKAYEDCKDTLAIAKKGLLTAYEALNGVLGVKSDTRYNFMEKLEFDPMEISELSLETHINQQVSGNIKVRLAEQGVEAAKVSVDYHTYNIRGSAPIDTKRNSLAQANLDLTNTKKQIEESIRSTYNALKTIEVQVEELRRQIEHEKKTLNLLKLREEVGVITKAEVRLAELGLFQKEQQMLTFILQYEELKIAYKNPQVN